LPDRKKKILSSARLWYNSIVPVGAGLVSAQLWYNEFLPRTLAAPGCEPRGFNKWAIGGKTWQGAWDKSLNAWILSEFFAGQGKFLQE